MALLAPPSMVTSPFISSNRELQGPFGNAEAWSCRTPPAAFVDPNKDRAWYLPVTAGEFEEISRAPSWFNKDDPLGNVMMNYAPPPLTPAPAAPPQEEVAAVPRSTAQASPISGYPPEWKMYDNITTGSRTIHFTPVPVPENNYGVVINAEYPTQARFVGMRGSENDDAIRNPHWQKLGQVIRQQDKRDKAESAIQWMHQHADYSQAVDEKGMNMTLPPRDRLVHHYSQVSKRRSADSVKETAERMRDQLRRDILNAEQIREFFSDREAVMYEGFM
jgi:hypothetical protein